MSEDGTSAIDDLLRHTDTSYASWRVIPFEDKRFGRIAALERVVKTLAKGMDLSPPPLASEVADAARALEKHDDAEDETDDAKKTPPEGGAAQAGRNSVRPRSTKRKRLAQ